MSVIQGIYIALFGRPADPGGLAYWNEVTKNGADLSEMLRVLPATEEYTSRFEGQTPDQVFTSIYLALFNREPDPEGLAFFKEQLASGAQNMATIAVNILQGAQGDDKAHIEAKVEAAELFTASLDTEAEIEAYKGPDAAALAKKFIDTVDKDNKPTADAVEKAADAVAAGQDPTEGQAPVGGGGGGGGDTSPTPQTLTLTTDTDRLTGGGADDTFNAKVAKSLNSTDVLNGGGGKDTLNISSGALADDTVWDYKGAAAYNTVLKAAGIEKILNADLNKTIDLSAATGVTEAWSDYSASAAYAYTRYRNGSADTVYGIAGGKDALMSLVFAPTVLTSEVIKLAVKDKDAASLSAFSINSLADVKNVEVHVGAGDQGKLALRNNIDNIKISGEGSIHYDVETFSFKVLDASALQGKISFSHIGGLKGDTTILTGAGDEVLNFSDIAHNLTLDGGAGNDIILGGRGNDIIRGGAGNDILWGDNPSNIALNPALYGDDTINGGAGTNVIILGTGTENVKLGGQDTVIHDVADGGTNVIFGFNFGPTDRIDGLTGGTSVDPGRTDADKTFDIVKFLNADKSAVKIFVGQDNAAYQGAVTDLGGPESFSGNKFLLAGNTVYAGNTDNLELKVQIGGSEIIFANAISKWELGGMLKKNAEEIGLGSLDAFITELNGKIDGDENAATQLVELNAELTTSLLGLLETQKNFDFG